MPKIKNISLVILICLSLFLSLYQAYADNSDCRTLFKTADERAGSGPRLSDLRAGSRAFNFAVAAQYTGLQDAVVGLKLIHTRSNAPIYLMTMKTAPQASIEVTNSLSNDSGVPHILEHILVGKTREAHKFVDLVSMELGAYSAQVNSSSTQFHIVANSGVTSFFKIFDQMLRALFAANISDEDITREAYYMDVHHDPNSGQYSLSEQGSIYAEMQSQQGLWNFWYEINKMVLGPGHTESFSGGGKPAVIRTLTPAAAKAYYRKHYVLGPYTPIIIAIDKSTDVNSFLRQLSQTLDSFSKEESKVVAWQHPKIVPPHKAELKVVPYPSMATNEPGTIYFAWSPREVKSLSEQLLLESLIYALNTRYWQPRLVDSETKKFDLPITAASMGTTNIAANHFAPRVYLGIEGIPPKQITVTSMKKLQSFIQKTLIEVSDLSATAPELAELKALALTFLRNNDRSLKIWHQSPPGFGDRELNSSWLQIFQSLELEPGAKKSLTGQDVTSATEQLLASPTNPWKKLIDQLKLADLPSGAAAVASADMALDLEIELSKRKTAEVERLKKFHNTNDEQQALAKQYALLHEEQNRPTAVAEKNSEKFTSSPPLTYDDAIVFKRTAIAGVPTVKAIFDQFPRLQLGLNFDLHGLPPYYDLYLPMLPELIRNTGIKTERETLNASEWNAKLAEEIEHLDATFAMAPRTNRMQLQITGSGTNESEFARALNFVAKAMHNNFVEEGNISRIRDLVDKNIKRESMFAKEPEEYWLNDLAQAFIYRENQLFLALNSHATKLHFLQRLRWRLKDHVSAETQTDLSSFTHTFFLRFENVPDEEVRSQLSQVQAEGLKQELIDYMLTMSQQFPPGELGTGLKRLATEVLADLQIGVTQALTDLQIMQAMVLNRARLSMLLVGDRALLTKATPKVRQLINSLPHFDLQSETTRSTETIKATLRNRYPDFNEADPIFVALVDDNLVTGNIVISSRPQDGLNSDRDALHKFLAGKIVSSDGDHSLFRKTWQRGLAYSNGIGVNPYTGTWGYYAERNPSIANTLRFVLEETKNFENLSDPTLVDAGFANWFSFSRVHLKPSRRATDMFDDLSDGDTPAKIRRLSRKVLKLRDDPELFAKLKERFGLVRELLFVPLESPAKGSGNKTIYFFVAPEQQLKELEAAFPNIKLYRTYPSDYWVD